MEHVMLAWCHADVGNVVIPSWLPRLHGLRCIVPFCHSVILTCKHAVTPMCCLCWPGSMLSRWGVFTPIFCDREMVPWWRVNTLTCFLCRLSRRAVMQSRLRICGHTYIHVAHWKEARASKQRCLLAMLQFLNGWIVNSCPTVGDSCLGLFDVLLEF